MLSKEMIKNSVVLGTPQVCADGSRLPFASNSIDVFLAMNMILFPQEIERCLKAEGFLVWISSRGSDTPIYLPPEEVVDLIDQPNVLACQFDWHSSECSKTAPPRPGNSKLYTAFKVCLL